MNETNNPKFVTRKWNIVNDNFTKYVTKIDETTIDDAENLHLVMPIYNLIEYSSSYCETMRSLWFYSKDEVANLNNNIAITNNFKSFKYKAKLLGNTVPQPPPNAANGIMRNVKTAVSLKYLNTFLRSLEMLLINYKVAWKVRWTKHCVFSVNGTDDANVNNDNNIHFTIKTTKLYVHVVTFSAIDNEKLSKLLIKGFERQFIRMNEKQKVIIKIQQTNLDIFSNQFLFGKWNIRFSLYKWSQQC